MLKKFGVAIVLVMSSSAFAGEDNNFTQLLDWHRVFRQSPYVDEIDLLSVASRGNYAQLRVSDQGRAKFRFMHDVTLEHCPVKELDNLRLLGLAFMYAQGLKRRSAVVRKQLCCPLREFAPTCLRS